MDNDKIIESLKDTRSSRTRRADIGINEENDEALKEIAINHFGHYNRSLMHRMSVLFFLKTYHKAYQFDPKFRDAVDIVSAPTINKDNVTDPYKMIKSAQAIADYIGMNIAWVYQHSKDLSAHGAIFKIHRGKRGGLQWAAIPMFLATYFASKYKPDSVQHGYYNQHTKDNL